MGWFAYLASVILGVLGHLTSKVASASAGSLKNLAGDPWFYLAGFLYGSSFILWLGFLKGRMLARTVPMAGLTYALVAVTATLLGERPAMKDWAGIALVILGVILLGK